mgnify:CR=1 FL=1
MPALVIGYGTSYVGEGEVGGLLDYHRYASGEISLDGAVTKNVLSNKTASGEYAFSGTVVTSITRSKQASGEVTFSGTLGAKQFTRTLTALLDLSAGTAIWAGKTTNATRQASGGLDFSGDVTINREFIFTSEYLDSLDSGMIVGGAAVEPHIGSYIGEAYVGYTEPASNNSFRFTGAAERAGQVTRFAYLGYPQVGVQFAGVSTANKAFNYTSDLTDYELFGTVYVPPRVSLAVAIWHADPDTETESINAADNSVWEGIVPDEPESSAVPVSVWETSGGGGGTIVGGGSVW